MDRFWKRGAATTSLNCCSGPNIRPTPSDPWVFKPKGKGPKDKRKAGFCIDDVNGLVVLGHRVEAILFSVAVKMESAVLGAAMGVILEAEQAMVGSSIWYRGQWGKAAG